MVKMNTMIVLVFSTLVISTWIQVSQCSKKQVGVARRDDIPFIKCQVCEKLVVQLHHQVEQKQTQISPKKISEFEIIEMSENVCNLKKAEADWILRIDIVEEEDKLKLVEQDSKGQCNSECKTIERACQEVMGYSDTDVAEYVYNNKPSIDSLVNYLCKDLTKACSVPPPPVPKDRTPGEPFVPKSQKEAEMEKIMKSMEGMPGAPGMKMYSREDLMNMENFGDEDDEDDDDDESRIPSGMGKILREKEGTKPDWKHTITKRIKETGQTLKRHAGKVSNRLQRWWREKTTSSKKHSKPHMPEL